MHKIEPHIKQLRRVAEHIEEAYSRNDIDDYETGLAELWNLYLKLGELRPECLK